MTWKTMKTVLWSAIGGALVWWIVLGTVFGWMSSGSAENQAKEQTRVAVLDVLTPICVARFQQDTEKEVKLAGLQQANSWSRDAFVTKQGWATMPGNEQPANGVAQACANRILASNGS
jgi:hypothetical protein